MKKLIDAVKQGGKVTSKHEIEVVCAHCGFDLDESELAADTCSDCGHKLNLRKSTRVYVTSVPTAKGDTLR